MESKLVNFTMVSFTLGILLTSVSPAMAKGIFKENTNTFYTSDQPLTTSTYCTTEAPGLSTTTTTVECAPKGERVFESPVMFTKKCRNTSLIETEVTAPVMIENTAIMPVVVEDRVVKAHHLFGIGIWPLFDFEVK